MQQNEETQTVTVHLTILQEPRVRKTKFAYFRDPGNTRRVLALAYRKTDVEGEYVVGYSVCAPEEQNFLKSRARQIAEGRMNGDDKSSFKVQSEGFMAQQAILQALRGGVVGGRLGRLAKRVLKARTPAQQ